MLRLEIISTLSVHENLYFFRIPNFSMKILKAFDKEVKGKEDYKHRINLPKKAVEESEFIDKK